MTSERGFRDAVVRACVVFLGIFALQCVLYGPCLLGSKLLLPLDLLARPGCYLPRGTVQPKSSAVFVDAVTHWELARQFTTREIRAGRIPFWDPASYAGAPFADFGKYSPFTAVRYVFPSPVAIAWVQVLKALVAGTGAYLFLRRVMEVRFWPGAVAAWLYPLTGFLILWQHDPISDVVVWYPAVLVMVDQVVRWPSGWGVAGIALVSCMAIVSGHVDIAGQVLLGGALFAVWSLVWRHGWRPSPALACALGALTLGFILGLMLAAPYVLPLANYAKTSQRFARRQAGQMERPPGSLRDLPQVAFAEWYGTTRPGTAYFEGQGNLPESAAGAYAGVLALLVAAPLAWTDRRRWGGTAFLTVSAGLGVLWVLGSPGAVWLLRLPGLDMMSHNRLTFWTSFAILALAATGLDSCWRDPPPWRRWFWMPVGVLFCLLCAALVRAFAPPQALYAALKFVSDRAPMVARASDTYLWCAALCAAGVILWLVRRTQLQRLWPQLLALAMGAELLTFAYGYHPQCDPTLYYPPLPVLQAIHQQPAGRTLCINCLPANLHLSQGLHEVRGYDAIDPQLILDLLDLDRDPTDHSPAYARAQLYRPQVGVSASGKLVLPPVLAMLNVRYVVFPNHLPISQQPLFADSTYAVYANSNATDRVWIPTQVQVVPEDSQVLHALSQYTFDPKQMAFVPTPLQLAKESRGTARIVAEEPCAITVAADMATPGLLVLADQWAAGWTAEVDSQPAEIIRTNHALKGVVLSAGSHTVVFRYDPPGLKTGLLCMGIACAVTLLCVAGPRRWLARGASARRPIPPSDFSRS